MNHDMIGNDAAGASWPRIDVVIATRDRPAQVREAIDGVWSQTYPGEIRCLVVHDQSDPDLTLCRRSENRSVEVMRNTHKPGLAGARNTGILAGDGDLVAFCDDDDVWLPDKCRLQVWALDKDTASTSVTGIAVEYEYRVWSRIPDPADLNLQTLARRRVMEAHPSTVMVRRSALSAIGLVDEDIPGSYGEDFDWMLRAVEHGSVTVVPHAMVRVHWGTSKFAQDWQTIIDAIDYGLAKHAVFGEDRQALGRLYGRRAFALAALGKGGVTAAVVRTLRAAPLERRAYLAAAVGMHLTSAPWLMDVAHKRGHGI
jgi:glycosyltransferase involved in cell wall biosynthesis